MNSKIQFDKKQLPQVIALGCLAVGLFGYFAWQMFAPAPKAPARPSRQKSSSLPFSKATTALTASSETDADSAIKPPAPDMRDPFIVPTSAIKQVAQPVTSAPPQPQQQQRPPAPSLPPLTMPSLTSVRPFNPAVTETGRTLLSAQPALTPPPSKPDWQLTGVVIDDTSSNGLLAIIRNGDQRRYVRPGSMLDGGYRVETVDMNGITLSLGSTIFRLTLGGAKQTSAGTPTMHAPNANPESQQSNSTAIQRLLSTGTPAGAK